MWERKGPQWGKTTRVAVWARGRQAQADIPRKDHQQRAPCPHGFISPWDVEMQEKSAKNMKAPGSAALGGSNKHKAGKTTNSEGYGLYWDGANI